MQYLKILQPEGRGQGRRPERGETQAGQHFHVHGVRWTSGCWIYPSCFSYLKSWQQIKYTVEI